MGVDISSPLLGWKLRAEGRGRKQTAYEIRAGNSPGSADLWDSGRVTSDESSDVPYGGSAPTTCHCIYWQVRIWDESAHASAWSRSSCWTAGMMNRADWQAHWIGHDPTEPSESLLLRREFMVRPGLKRAVVFVTGLGQYELHVNGQKVGDDLLTPGWTDYRKTVLYDTYDVTRYLKTGSNAAGVLLGNGMDNVHGPRYTKFSGTFGPQRALVQLNLEYADGSSETVVSDKNWGTRPGPITFSSVYGGEDYDLRLESPGWDEPNFTANWTPAKEMDGPGGELRGASSAAPPIRSFEVLKPKKIYTVKKGVETVDLGQNASIMLRLTAEGPAGSSVRVVPAELIKQNGEVDRSSVGGGDAWWQLTLDGRKASYSSKFFYQGSRYLQVECTGGARLNSIEGVVIHSSAPEVGEFSCSSDLFNRIHTLIRWAQENNTVSVLTDCPHRERLGWLEQYHLNGPSLRYEHNLSTLYAKTSQDMEDAQLPNGLVPDIAPEFTVFDGPFRDSPEWGSAAILVPWQQYLFHRGLRLLSARYESMKKYLAYLRSTATDHIVSHGLGDWYDIGPGEPGGSKNTPVPLTATAFYYEDARVLAQVAVLLGKTEDEATLQAESEAIKVAFNHQFFNTQAGFYATGSQTACAIPLVMGIVDESHHSSVFSQLVRDIESRHLAITAGDVGYRYVLRALADGGRSDLVFSMNNQTDKPGYGYQLKMGATSLTEAWDSNPSSSQDHFMLGQIVEWLYHDLCGIRPGDGFKKFIIHPCLVPKLNWARASYLSEYGRIECGWHRLNHEVVFEVTVPPNSSATVQLPGRQDELIGSGHYSYRISTTPDGNPVGPPGEERAF